MIIRIAILSMLLAVKIVVSAQITSVSDLKLPTMGDHIFSRLEKPTFIGTYVGNNLGVGFNGDFDLPFSVPGIDTTFNVNGELFYATLNIEYQQRVKEWMAFNFEVGLNARVGLDEVSLIAEGFREIDYTNAGWLVRFYKSDKFYISSLFQLQRLSGTYINVAEYISDLLDPNEKASFSNKISNTSASVALNLVWAPSDLFALISNSSFGYGDHILENRDVFLYNFHVATDLNFFSRWNFPLGTYFGYERNNLAELFQRPNQYTDIISYKLNYTGSRDFNFTLEGNTTYSPVEIIDGRVRFTNVIFSIRVYF